MTACENGKVTNLTASANTTNNITSPYYNDGYPKDSNCAWRITAPPGQFIKLQVKSDLSCYLNDQLNIYDSDTNNAEQHIAKICDEGKLRTIVSTGETLYISFVTNSTKVIYYNYFIIHYSSYLPGKCGIMLILFIYTINSINMSTKSTRRNVTSHHISSLSILALIVG